MGLINTLYISPSSGVGGVETFIKNTWLGHNKDLIKPTYFLFRKGPLYSWLIDHGAHCILATSAPRISRPISWLRIKREIQATIREYNIQITHSSMAYGALFSALAAQKNSCHVWFQHGPASSWQDSLAGLLPHQALITNSNFMTQEQIKYERPLLLSSKRREILELHLGTPKSLVTKEQSLEARNDLLKKYNLEPSTRLISMMCRIQSWKGVHHLIQATRELTSKGLKTPFHILIWGEAFNGSRYLTELQEQAQGLPLSFEGHSSTPQLALSSTDILINASTQPEPFGLTIIEAMSTGTIPIAPNWGGPSEIITHDLDGLLFNPTDTTDLAKKISYVLTSPQTMERLKSGALSSFEKKYQLSHMIERLETFYQTLIS